MSVCIGDTSVYIVGRHKQGAMYYDIVVWQGKQNWQCMKRYSEFEQLHRSLLASGFVLPGFPRKSIFSSRFSDSFLDERQNELQNIIRSAVAADPRLTNPALRNFLGLPSHMQAPSMDYAAALAAPSAPPAGELSSAQALQGVSSSPVTPANAQAAPTVQAIAPRNPALGGSVTMARPVVAASAQPVTAHAVHASNTPRVGLAGPGANAPRYDVSARPVVGDTQASVCAQPIPVVQATSATPAYAVPAQQPAYAIGTAPAYASSPMPGMAAAHPTYPVAGQVAPPTVQAIAPQNPALGGSVTMARPVVAQQPTYAIGTVPAYASSPMPGMAAAHPTYPLAGQVAPPYAVYPSPGMAAPYAAYPTSAAHHCHGHGQMHAGYNQGHGMLAAGAAGLIGGMMLESALENRHHHHHHQSGFGFGGDIGFDRGPGLFGSEEVHREVRTDIFGDTETRTEIIDRDMFGHVTDVRERVVDRDMFGRIEDVREYETTW
eukprot:TRINITY_DN2756_c0_g2_i4.p1 TRINITY_DN2756_c0_g2~~TRINITY_DN2756_c0_g2_i4.p1  ORF type:complete len:490 (+),score=55.62 TRINITY_DN2756_c0_g2_i4:63-1532(+)